MPTHSKYPIKVNYNFTLTEMDCFIVFNTSFKEKNAK